MFESEIFSKTKIELNPPPPRVAFIKKQNIAKPYLLMAFTVPGGCFRAFFAADRQADFDEIFVNFLFLGGTWKR
ncbi:MAG: hypothetical protein LBC77_06845 [Spirochaetaceae bacterium]|jgi:hypothetical protein|nr:hypothetical protein [Spirochaetaceae bacterium]